MSKLEGFSWKNLEEYYNISENFYIIYYNILKKIFDITFFQPNECIKFENCSRFKLSGNNSKNCSAEWIKINLHPLLKYIFSPTKLKKLNIRETTLETFSCKDNENDSVPP